MSQPAFAPSLDAADVARILSAPQVGEQLGHRLGTPLEANPLAERAYRVVGPGGDFVVRFPADQAQLLMLEKEERVQRGMREWVSLSIPDTTVIADLEGCPAFAIHRMIPGRPLTSECLAELSPQAHRRLVTDLAHFFDQAHRIPLPAACGWLGIPYQGEETAAQLAPTHGKPTWFGPQAVAEIRLRLALRLDVHHADLFEDTVRRFQALGTDPRHLAFGHGDMHGYNVAMGQDDLGPRLIGAFDLGCAGILDLHEDLFRLSLIGEELLERVVDAYRRLPGQTRSPRWYRLTVYYRAFLFYLMAERAGGQLDHLQRLLQRNIEHCGADLERVGSAAGAEGCRSRRGR